MSMLRFLRAEVMQTRLSFQWETPQDAPELVDTDTIDSGEGMNLHALRAEWPRHNASVEESAIERFRDVFRTKKTSEQLQSGFLENTFLLVDPTCVHSVLAEGTYIQDRRKREWRDRPLGYNNMRVLAVGAEYPVPSKAYAEGYKGYAWVRVRQLCDRFYEQRWRHPEIDMDMIWEAAQDRKHHAFDGMDSGDELSTNVSETVRRFQDLYTSPTS